MSPADAQFDHFTPCTDDALDAVIAHRKTVLQKSDRSSGRGRYQPRSDREDPLSDAMLSEVTLDSLSLWELRITNLPIDFFNSEEARLEPNLSNSNANKSLAYASLALDEALNPDLQDYYSTMVEPHVFRSQCLQTYKILKTVLGQLARYACAMRRHESLQYSKKGGLVSLAADEKLLRAFVLGMQTRCVSSTVCSKASNLLKWAKFASIFYAKEQDVQAKAHCDAAAEYLRTTACAEKRDSRKATALKRNIFTRHEGGNIILLEDLERGQQRAEQCMRGILHTMKIKTRVECTTTLSRRQEEVFDILVDKDAILLRKWCLNFLCLLVLHGGGQRSQVYSSLDLSAFGINESGHVVRSSVDVRKACESSGYFYLQAMHEKRLRSSRMPYIQIPSSIYDLYVVHKDLVRPSLLKRVSPNVENGSCDALLLHTENGNPLTEKQVSATVKKFYRNLDSELRGVTPLVIRRSYASIMYHKFLRGEICRNKSKAQFLEFLAERLNTSVEQLQDSYCGEEPEQDTIARIYSIDD